MKQYVIGIDIGGTKVAIDLVSMQGKVVASAYFEVLSKKESLSSLSKMTEAIDELLKNKKLEKKSLKGIGVGSPGPVDSKKGVLPWSPHLPGWKGTPIVRVLKQKFKVPVYLANDANVGALCEKHFGVGKKVKSLIYITVSTGIGGGIILNEQIYAGHSFGAGEIGHMILVPGGNLCHCGKKGCFEAYASGTAVAKKAKKFIKENPNSQLAKLLKKEGGVSSKTLKQAFVRGNKDAKKIFSEQAMFLGVGVASLINLLNPAMIVFGGGVFQPPKKAADFIWKEILASTKKHAWKEPLKNCKVVRTQFTKGVGSLGAAALAIENLKQKV